MMERIIRNIKKHIPFEFISNKRILNELLEMESIVKLNAFGFDYIPWTGSAIKPSALVKILNDIAYHNRTAILELGSGISTYYLAKVMQQNNGILYTVDHENEWLDIVTTELEKYKLLDSVNVIHTELIENTLNEDTGPWYDVEKIKAEIDRPIDLLVVDGPPAYMEGSSLSRYPALPLLNELMNDDCAIFLDDIHRKGEASILKKWSNSYNYDATVYKDQSVGYLKRNQRRKWNIDK
jgi:predicted O-methyltransferase YrrM